MKRYLYKIEGGSIGEFERIFEHDHDNNSGAILQSFVQKDKERTYHIHPAINLVISPIMSSVGEFYNTDQIEEILNDGDFEQVIKSVLSESKPNLNRHQIVDIRTNLDTLCLKDLSSGNEYYCFKGILSSDIVYIDGRHHVRENALSGHYYPGMDCGYVIISDQPL